MLQNRGEFVLILATLATAAGLDPRLTPFAGLYVLSMAIDRAGAGRQLRANRFADLSDPPSHGNPERDRMRAEGIALVEAATSGLEPAQPHRSTRPSPRSSRRTKSTTVWPTRSTSCQTRSTRWRSRPPCSPTSWPNVSAKPNPNGRETRSIEHITVAGRSSPPMDWRPLSGFGDRGRIRGARPMAALPQRRRGRCHGRADRVCGAADQRSPHRSNPCRAPRSASW